MKLKIYCGREKPVVVTGVNQCRLAEFALKHQGWHSYNMKCRSTVRSVRGLERHGVIEVNQFDQFRWKPAATRLHAVSPR